MEARDKLAHLIPHWVEHNQSHIAQFEEWAAKARQAGLSVAAEHVAAAAEAMKEANRRLERAGEGLR
ncbi:MAG: hypothetical protein JSV79_03250 [Armatimonadota bacterium]|nr:MAG: hypothetical protein JSV79_03250 [Armatimonadota bacterium]